MMVFAHRLASFWLGAQQSGYLIKVADVIDPGGRWLEEMMSEMQLGSEESKSPLQGTNLNIRLYPCGLMVPEVLKRGATNPGLFWESFLKWSADLTESKSTRKALHLRYWTPCISPWEMGGVSVSLKELSLSMAATIALAISR